ncbi:uncharacterized protein PHACADRAFT_123163 [Phanerochaete carnosa HHB-10118-sp]|uniref:Pyridoxamine 5'-phosphate oxidase putative domain-containing protein n=1 Tax=Phanerochaete carnosa (strain HHB-10118-sp) TaxID=650164 RepID=K5VRX8_PHACS|nr:uncharacterized protein PHACADRAFT_123163 [Phanerochaete carnosa HHB-10118-sp]EKM54258.1 hypothetical protein PHACADRAFT_123163 [Phanerochaete carnosa HHB-10118-sp]
MSSQFYDDIPDDEQLIEWIRAQQLFHVATAPLHGGHVNVSPKGQPTFKLVSRKAVWYLDLTGSGNETISHLYEPGNGRMTMIFEAFEGPPRILRLFGHGKVIERGTPEFDQLLQSKLGAYDWPTPEVQPGARAIIWLEIDKVGISRGSAVPIYKFEGHRDVLKNWSEKAEKTDSEHEDPFTLPPLRGLKSFWLHNNSWSMDGLPGYRPVSHKADESFVRKAMSDVGLNYDTAHVTRQRMSDWWLALSVGVGLGIVLTTAITPVTKELLHL